MIDIEKQKYIRKLAKMQNVVILAHYYVVDEIQEIADFLGDSLYLAQRAKESTADTILFCGVNFMAETAKILNPSKKVIVPDNKASCSLAEGVDVIDCFEWKKTFPNPYLISYINCATEIKTISDIICTSSNVLQVVNSAPKNSTVLFAPDINLGNWVNRTLGKNMKLWNGHCVVHQNYSENALIETINKFPAAEIVAHPECPDNILKYAHFVGSTTAIIDYSTKSNNSTIIVLTEEGVGRTLQIQSPDKKFIFISHKNGKQHNVCVNMKKHTLDKIIYVLENGNNEINIDENIRIKALQPLEKMLAIS
jgi:quinolinate synthase